MAIEYTPEGAYLSCEGNSLTSGSGSTDGLNYPTQLRSMPPMAGATLRNGGSAGQTIARMLTYTGPIVDTYYKSGKAFVLMVWEGTNAISIDTDNGRRTGAQALAEIRQYCLDRIAARPTVKIILLTTMPMMGGYWGTAVANQHILEYNAGILANAASWGVAHVVDVRRPGSPWHFTGYTDADFNAPSVAPYWQAGEAQHVHLNNAGYGVIAGMVAEALTAIAGATPAPPAEPAVQKVKLASSTRVRLRGAGGVALTTGA